LFDDELMKKNSAWECDKKKRKGVDGDLF